MRHLFLLSIIYIFALVGVQKAYAFEPFTVIGATAVVSMIAIPAINRFYCNFTECCDDYWLTWNLSGLDYALSERLYGQPLVRSTLVEALKMYQRDVQPRKALVFALHGSTGLGKTYLSRLLVQHLFRKGEQSTFVRRYSHSAHFPDPRLVFEYQEKLRRELKQALRHCGRALFVFDEVEKMPAGLLDGLRAWIDYDAVIDGVDARRAVFVLLSNAAGPEINAYMLQHWRNGKPREQADAAALHDIVQETAYNSAGGLSSSGLISQHLVNYFIPFLPLERSHVKLCVRDELERRGCLAKYARYGEDHLAVVLEEVANELSYAPDAIKLYSSRGCKLVDSALVHLKLKKPDLVTCL